MSEAEDSRLYGLMEIAEGQQAAVQAALEGLAAERAALRREREALARPVQAVEGSARAAVRAAVAADSLAEAATEGVAAVQAATWPLLDRVAGVTAEAGQAEAALRSVVLWASWRLLGWIAAMGAMTVLLGWLMSSGILWWNTSAIGAVQERKAELQAEVVELKANRDALVKAGMLGKLERRGPKARPCIRVDESVGGFGNRDDFRVILGY